jgi:DUF1680 family protein
VNGEAPKSELKDGYVLLSRSWQKGDVIELDMPMTPQRIQAHPKVGNDRGHVALQRGPIVYCLEAVDNGGKVKHLALPPEATVEAELKPDLLGGVVVLKAKALTGEARSWQNRLYQPAKSGGQPAALTAIPYYTWDNRQAGEMVVWIPETVGLAAP